MAFCSCGMCFFFPLGGGVCHPCNFLVDSKPLTCHQNSPVDGHSLEPLPNARAGDYDALQREGGESITMTTTNDLHH